MTGATARDVRRLQRAFELIAADGPERAGAQEDRLGFVDHLRVPPRRILIGQRHIVAVLIATRAAAGFRMEHEGEQPQRLGLGRQQFGDEPAEEDCFIGEIAPRDIGPGGIDPAFRKGRVDCIEHGVEPIAKFCSVRDAKRDARLQNFVFRAHQALAHRSR